MSNVGVEEEDEVAVAVGRLRMRRTGWKASGGGDTAELLVLEPAMTSSGMGVRLLLR